MHVDEIFTKLWNGKRTAVSQHVLCYGCKYVWNTETRTLGKEHVKCSDPLKRFTDLLPRVYRRERKKWFLFPLCIKQPVWVFSKALVEQSHQRNSFARFDIVIKSIFHNFCMARILRLRDHSSIRNLFFLNGWILHISVIFHLLK